jgi:uncharacterized membrane protein YwzB
MISLIDLLVIIVLSISGTAFGITYWSIRQNKADKKLSKSKVETILKPYVFQAIIVAYKISEKAFDDLENRLAGVDKKQIADSVYDMLPSEINGVPVVYLKAWISKEEFSLLIENLFLDTLEFMQDHQLLFDEQYNAWLIKQSKFEK